ncbi:hypothetical protein C9374_012068 [Naegleria lovaniensis]|uniref:Uncharacterized protein n=1 Tax=Naegleria lovaniensis TaxID=51637 RepID=A0AA88KER5_NAELO|nr:uncharacterized protein C9374_012068 [Naegleria lovaniensis]KAG2373461.1 hypothetical protein C9374_012068 [Naegleria lovaniensis]
MMVGSGWYDVSCAAAIDHTNRILPSTTTPYYLAHLHPLDQISSSWSFYCNVPGSKVQDHSVRNAGSDIRLVPMNNVYNFQVGIQGAEVGKILDLGTVDDLVKSYGCDLYSSFTGIQFVDGVLVIPNKSSTKQNTPIDLSKMTSDMAEVKLGHVYLVKISRGNEDTALFAKFMTTSVVTDNNNQIQTVTMRHQTMYVYVDPSSGRGNCKAMEDSSVSTEAETAISLSVIALLVSIIVGVGNVVFLIYYCAFATKKRGGVFTNLQ